MHFMRSNNRVIWARTYIIWVHFLEEDRVAAFFFPHYHSIYVKTKCMATKGPITLISPG